MMKAGIMMLLSAVAAGTAVSTVQMPLNYHFNTISKISTNVVVPGTQNRTILVEYDLGSTVFFLFGPNSTMNWGGRYLGQQGQCNVSVPEEDTYDPSKSPTATPEIPFRSNYGYGGGLNKLYRGHVAFNDTFTFVNTAGHCTTVPNLQVALVDYLQQRLEDASGKCTPAPGYNPSIMGIAPYYYQANNVTVHDDATSFRQSLLAQGLIGAPVHSMWFDKAPHSVEGTYTGTGLLGGIDTSKYKGPLVKVPSLRTNGQPGYWTVRPNVTYNGVAVALQPPSADDRCMVDSGAYDGIAVADAQAFLNLTGLRYNPKRPGLGQFLSWPGPCHSIPAHRFIEYSMAGVDAREKAVIKVPMRAYARYQEAADVEIGWCTLRLYLGGSAIGAPFLSAAFFAADDERVEMAFAQGGVSEPGSEVDAACVVARIP